jgi:DNA ligase-associated metallophosphoesterase
MPERAAFWREKRMLLIADPHLGKAAAFRASGVPVPAGTTGEGLSRLQSAVERSGAKTVAFLGDLLHAKAGRSASLFEALAEWRRTNLDVDILLVRGNHDRRAGDPPPDLGIDCVDAPHVIAPLVLAHHPASHDSGYVVAGHVHPGVRLYGPGGQRLRLSCFVFGRDYAVLPAFGDFTGLADAEPGVDTRVYAVADGAVIPVTSPA